jgi:hypothetical protein
VGVGARPASGVAAGFMRDSSADRAFGFSVGSSSGGGGVGGAFGASPTLSYGVTAQPASALDNSSTVGMSAPRTIRETAERLRICSRVHLVR